MITIKGYQRGNTGGTNRIIESPVDVSDDSGIIQEPVTVAELDNYIREQGFEDDGDSGELPFTSDDTLKTEVLIGARQAIEFYTGRSLVAHVWRTRLENGAGGIKLPYSNNGEITEIKDCQGDIVTDAVTTGIEFLHIQTPIGELTVTYETPGYCPKRLKLAIMAEALFRLENRGDLADNGSICEKAMSIAVSYKETDTWLA